VIYCVVPGELAGELFDKLSRYYADDPGVTVIIDRRRSSRRERGSPSGGRREVRDRRRPRVAGEFPKLADPDGAPKLPNVHGAPQLPDDHGPPELAE
jgi:hypothetical protein